MPSYINSMVHLSNKSCHRGSPISGSRNCSSDTKLSKLCPVDVLTLFVLRKALLSVCIGFFSYSPACSSHGIDGYQTLIDQTRPAFTTPVESVSGKEVPGQAVLSQQASWTNQILSEHPKGKVDFLFLESTTSAFILWNLFSSCVPTRKKLMGRTSTARHRMNHFASDPGHFVCSEHERMRLWGKLQAFLNSQGQRTDHSPETWVKSALALKSGCLESYLKLC